MVTKCVHCGKEVERKVRHSRTICTACQHYKTIKYSRELYWKKRGIKE